MQMRIKSSLKIIQEASVSKGEWCPRNNVDEVVGLREISSIVKPGSMGAW